MDPKETIYFPTRELQPGAEPVDLQHLKVGAYYFAVQYIDEDLCVPTVETLVYLGRGLQPGDEGLLYFQNADSYSGKPFRPGMNALRANVYAQPEDQVNHIFDFEHGLEELMRCLVRRKRNTTLNSALENSC
jgi:hypothetical protein